MLKATPLVRIDGEDTRNDQDLVAVEAPLTLRVADADGLVDLGVFLRTPGDDVALGAGMLYTEGVIADAADIDAADITLADDGVSATLIIQLAAARRVDRAALARAGTVTTACGLCGRLDMPPLSPSARPIAREALDPAVVAALPDRMHASQSLFAGTGAAHAAAAFTTDGALVAIAEDVGRHNAVDKLVGRLLLDGALPAATLAVAVSGRVAFELVHKAAAAGFCALVAVGAPTSLAIQAARAAGLPLIGFARDGRFNRYP